MWEASYQVWRTRTGRRDDAREREVWAEASLAVRVRQAERWLAIMRRTRRG